MFEKQQGMIQSWQRDSKSMIIEKHQPMHAFIQVVGFQNRLHITLEKNDFFIMK